MANKVGIIGEVLYGTHPDFFCNPVAIETICYLMRAILPDKREQYDVGIKKLGG